MSLAMIAVGASWFATAATYLMHRRLLAACNRDFGMIADLLDESQTARAALRAELVATQLQVAQAGQRAIHEYLGERAKQQPRGAGGKFVEKVASPPVPGAGGDAMLIEPPFDLGQAVIVDGDLRCSVIGVTVLDGDGTRVKVGWCHNGQLVEEWLPLWRVKACA